MKRSLPLMLAAMLLAACSTKVEQPDPGVGLGEIYLTAPAGTRTVAVDLDGLWRVSALEEWISLDVNGREGKGAFTFSCTSNESDFSQTNPTRLGHIVIQSLRTMKADTLYVRQQGMPDGRDYESRDESGYIEFIDEKLHRTNVAYADLDGAEDASVISSWMEEEQIDVLAAVCPLSLAEILSGMYEGHCIREEGLVVICPSSVPEEVSSTAYPLSLTVKADDIRYVVSDFGRDAQANRHNQMRDLLSDGYNAPLSKGRWLVGGTFWYLSAMEAGYAQTPSWYPSDPKDTAFDADLYAWKNNLLDCVWMVNRDFTSTYMDEDGRFWRPTYLYASPQAWNAVVRLEVLDVPAAGMKHSPVKITLKY